MKIAELV